MLHRAHQRPFVHRLCPPTPRSWEVKTNPSNCIHPRCTALIFLSALWLPRLPRSRPAENFAMLAQVSWYDTFATIVYALRSWDTCEPRAMDKTRTPYKVSVLNREVTCIAAVQHVRGVMPSFQFGWRLVTSPEPYFGSSFETRIPTDTWKCVTRSWFCRYCMVR